MEQKCWNGFNPGPWQTKINVRDFIQRNFTEYKGGPEFLAGATARTNALMEKVRELFALERKFN